MAETYQVDPDQLGTTKTHKLNHTEKHAHAGEVRCFSMFTGRKRVAAEDIHRCYCLRNLARSRPILKNQTSGGASVTHACTPSRWWETLWCYSGAYLYPCCSQDHLNHTTSKTNGSGNVVWPPGLCTHTKTHTLASGYFGKQDSFSDPHQQKCECGVPLGDEIWLRCSGLAALFFLSDRNYLIEKSEPGANSLQGSSRNTKLLRLPQQD